jgi:hypothetical protein
MNAHIVSSPRLFLSRALKPVCSLPLPHLERLLETRARGRVRTQSLNENRPPWRQYGLERR